MYEVPIIKNSNNFQLVLKVIEYSTTDYISNFRQNKPSSITFISLHSTLNQSFLASVENHLCSSFSIGPLGRHITPYERIR